MITSDFSSEYTTKSSSTSLSAYKSFAEKSISKKIKEATDSFVSILETFAVYSKIVHGIVAVIRILQLLGPSINPGNQLVWGTGNVYRFINYISICWFLIPASAETLTTSAIVCLVFSLICAFHVLTFYLGALKVQKTMHISGAFSYFLNLITVTCGHIALPIASSSLASMLGFFLRKFRKRKT